MDGKASYSSYEVEEGEVGSSDEGGMGRTEAKQSYCEFVEEEGAILCSFGEQPPHAE